MTLLLSVAVSSPIVSFERLHKDEHPSGDKERFNDARLALDES